MADNAKQHVAAAKPWAYASEEVLAALGTDISGLSAGEAERRLSVHGANELPEEEKDPAWKEMLGTFNDPMILILLAAAVVSAIVGFGQGSHEELWSAGLLVGIVVFMAVFDFLINMRADASLEALKKLSLTTARVYRDGKLIEIEAAGLVPGDVIVIGEGDVIPADARVLSVEHAQTFEAILTGESEPIKKQVDAIDASLALGDRTNMVWNGTNVEAGSIVAVVTATGINTQIGKIWEDLRDADETDTPMQAQLDKLAKVLMWATLTVCFIVVGVYILRGFSWLDALLVSVALAIAFIPEALGAVINIALAFGVNEMTQWGAIIKKLRAAEGLGSISIMATDKTGTITEGKMKAAQVWVAGQGLITVDGANGMFSQPGVQRLVQIAQLCNDLVNATEKALADLAALAGFELTADTKADRLSEVPFNSARKMMSTVYPNGGNGINRMHTKGAPDRLLERCDFILVEGEVVPITESHRREVLRVVGQLEDEAKRVLAFADRDLDGVSEIGEEHEDHMTFVGLVALFDPIRPEVPGVVAEMRGAGIRAVMITGDSPRTAAAIARKATIIGEYDGPEAVVTGPELDQILDRVDGDPDRLTEEQVQKIAGKSVFARVSPRNKTQLVKIFQRAGNLVAMSGDGVNDAPSLKQADVGIAMDRGADVTKATADVVLTGTYQALEKAVEVGRTILHRTQLYSHALLSTNGAEIGIFIVAVAVGWPAPFTAVQLLLINILGDAWLSIALATEKAEKDVMKQQPRDPKAGIITRYMFGSIGLQSVVTTTIMAVAWIMTSNWAKMMGMEAEATYVLQQSTLFAVFMTQKVLRSSFTARSLKFSTPSLGLFSNRNTILAALATIALALVGLYVPIFGMTPIPTALVPLLALGLIPPFVEEVVKAIRRR